MTLKAFFFFFFKYIVKENGRLTRKSPNNNIVARVKRLVIPSLL